MTTFDVYLFELSAALTRLDQEDDTLMRDFDNKPSYLKPTMVLSISKKVQAEIDRPLMLQVEAAFNAKIEAYKLARFFYELGTFQALRFSE